VSPRPSFLLRAAVTVAVVVGGLLVPASSAVAFGQDAGLARQEDPGPDTSPVPADGAEPEPAGDPTIGDDAPSASKRAQDDLRAVWIIVAALVVVAVALLGLLVLFVRATNPARSAERREEQADNEGSMADEGDSSDPGDGAAPTEPALAPSSVDGAPTRAGLTPTSAARPPRPSRPSSSGGARKPSDHADKVDPGLTHRSGDGAPGAKAIRTGATGDEPAPTDSVDGPSDRDSEASNASGPDEGHGVAEAQIDSDAESDADVASDAAAGSSQQGGAEEAAQAESAMATEPALADQVHTGLEVEPSDRAEADATRARSDRATGDGAPAGDPAPDEPVEDLSVTEAGVDGPEAGGGSQQEVPQAGEAGDDGRASSVEDAEDEAPHVDDAADAGGADQAEDRGDETVRIVSPAMAPSSLAQAQPLEPRRPRRVREPAKRLGTPDAERVLVRPGQPPVRVPAQNPTPTSDGGERGVPPRRDGPTPPVPEGDESR